MHSTLRELRNSLRDAAHPEIALRTQRFFKTGAGAYAKNDRFLGIRVPVLRQFVRQYRSLPLPAIGRLLRSPFHEERFVALNLLIDQYRRGDAVGQQQVIDCYLRNIRYVNNWDLVDCSAHHLLGEHLVTRSRRKLRVFARSPNLWERRIAIVATMAFIARGEFFDTIEISRMLLRDSHDLIHKAVGWMLREVGKRARSAEEEFLCAHYRAMPRIMLRYAIEHFPEKRRQAYLHGTVA
ncbi:DNA alkylation repair protein [Candidatus Uhrbacteria bacterium]|nr:DNA alkylation repair protein [Candidatus Uhrbacteria bacterium]